MTGKCPFHFLTPRKPSSQALNQPSAETLTQKLKKRTQPLHDHVEAHPQQAAVMSGRAGLSGYVALLHQMAHVHAALEAAMRTARAHNPSLASVVRDRCFHLNALQADLAALAAPQTPAPPLPETQAFCDAIAQASRAPAWPLLGIFYVLEGSTNGGVVIAQSLNRSLGLSPARGTSFINPYGPEVRTKWAETKAGIDALTLDPQQEEALLQAACHTFQHFGALLSALASAKAPLAASTPAARPAAPVA